MASDITSDVEYIFDPIVTDEDALVQEAFDWLQSQWPDWRPFDSNLETWIILACARMVAEARDVASDVPSAIFRYYGSTILGLPPIDATPATVDSTWTLTSNPAGRTITAGTLVIIEDADSQPRSFEVIDDVTVASPTLTTAVGGVSLRSIEEGSDLSGLGGPGAVAQQQDATAWIGTITLTGTTTGGIDGETDEQYQDRLRRRLTLQGGGLVLPANFQFFAEDIAAQNGVIANAMVIDGYNPADGTLNNEKMVAIFMRDASTGLALPGGVKTIVDAQVQENREVNFVANVLDPDGPYGIDVSYIGVAEAGFDSTLVGADVDANLAAFLATATWGFDTSSDSLRWRNTTVVRFQDISAVLNNTAGFDHWTSLTIGLSGGSMSSSDVTLTGAAPLVMPGSILGTMT